MIRSLIHKIVYIFIHGTLKLYQSPVEASTIFMNTNLKEFRLEFILDGGTLPFLLESFRHYNFCHIGVSAVNLQNILNYHSKTAFSTLYGIQLVSVTLQLAHLCCEAMQLLNTICGTMSFIRALNRLHTFLLLHIVQALMVPFQMHTANSIGPNAPLYHQRGWLSNCVSNRVVFPLKY